MTALAYGGSHTEIIAHTIVDAVRAPYRCRTIPLGQGVPNGVGPLSRPEFPDPLQAVIEIALNEFIEFGPPPHANSKMDITSF